MATIAAARFGWVARGSVTPVLQSTHLSSTGRSVSTLATSLLAKDASTLPVSLVSSRNVAAKKVARYVWRQRAKRSSVPATRCHGGALSRRSSRMLFGMVGSRKNRACGSRLEGRSIDGRRRQRAVAQRQSEFWSTLGYQTTPHKLRTLVTLTL
jgi:hypothetical protein